MMRPLGNTGVRVYPVGWGPMPLSTRATRPDRAGALEVFKAALEAGIDFIDTADAYCLDHTETGHNEQLIAWALHELGATGRVHVTSKSGMTRPNGAWVRNGHPAHIRAACEQSLRDLGVETLFLYQLHWPDPEVPYADSVGTLADLQREGKIRHAGISNVTPELLREALGIVRVESVQNRCGPDAQDDFGNGLVALCAQENITYIPYSPMGGGTGFQSMAEQPVLSALARERGVSVYQVILAWLLGKGGHIVPIPGASRPGNVRDSAAAAKLSLSPEDAARIDAI